MRAVLTYAALFAITLFSAIDARKSFVIKEKIVSGEIKVASPRVQAYDCQWCFFKDKNNDWCILLDLNWRLDSANENYN
jgi:hypothetical protein